MFFVGGWRFLVDDFCLIVWGGRGGYDEHIWQLSRLAVIVWYFLQIVVLGVLFIVVLCCSVAFMLFTGLKQRTEIVPQKGGAGCSNVYLYEG